MTQDIVDINRFYDSAIGAMASDVIGACIRRQFPDSRKKKILILGFGIPFADIYDVDHAEIFMAMPASFGVMYWPEEGDNRAILCHERALPFADQSFDHVLMVHAVEYAGHLDGMMKEVWRVLKGNGRLVMVAPNRGSIWSRAEKMPFAHGQPFSARQMMALCKKHRFVCGPIEKALYFFPWEFCFEPKSAAWLEKWGKYLFLLPGGVLVTSATKRLYALTPSSGTPVRWRAPVMVPKGLSSN